LNSKLFGPDGDFDDIIGSIGDTSTGGDILAKDFFDELRNRDETTQSTETSYPPEDRIIGKIQNPSAETPVTRTEAMYDDDYDASPKTKFTGQEGTYARRPSAPETGLRGRTPREMMLEREYQLVGRAERGIAFQAIVAVIALAFYVYIGLSGGIVSGADAQMQDFGADDEIPFEQVMPVQRDREVRVWL
jgi:hypothetical protein